MAIEAILAEDRVIIWSKSGRGIFEEDYFGKLKEDRLDLSLIEAAYLLDTEKIKILDVEEKEIDKKAFIKYCQKIDPRFDFRYSVYKDLRSKQFPTRTGFKFGCDFRVYAKGVKPLKRGPKSAKEHTKWIVYAVPEKFVCSFQELSRAVRLAHNIRANMLWAVVGEEGDIKYFQVTFFKP